MNEDVGGSGRSDAVLSPRLRPRRTVVPVVDGFRREGFRCR